MHKVRKYIYINGVVIQDMIDIWWNRFNLGFYLHINIDQVTYIEHIKVNISQV